MLHAWCRGNDDARFSRRPICLIFVARNSSELLGGVNLARTRCVWINVYDARDFEKSDECKSVRKKIRRMRMIKTHERHSRRAFTSEFPC
jgi:hypothetical protein